MKTIPIHEVKTNLSKYVKQAKAGKPVYFGSFGKSEVVLMAIPKSKNKSAWGSMKGSFNFSSTQWDEASKKVNEDIESSGLFPQQ